MRFKLLILFFFTIFSAFAQEIAEPIKVVDSLYREDQFYFNFTYNKLQNFKGLSQTKFSPGICLGILRDMPVNKARTIAFATGLGYSINIYNNNLQGTTTNSNTNSAYSYDLLSTADFMKNKFVQHYIDLPIEIRWRTSTAASHEFWRIYTGFKLSYLIYDQYKYVADGLSINNNSNPDFNKLVYGCYLAAGYNTWNLYAYYGLKPIFKSVEINGEKINTTTFNIGLQFYIL
ncbi:porin family protein [Flavobacterium sp.]|uniref:porin family protein n=1 Tax=Flavobacterium sp. TaxID=239 RepID=UPI003BB9E9BD